MSKDGVLWSGVCHGGGLQLSAGMGVVGQMIEMSEVDPETSTLKFMCGSWAGGIAVPVVAAAGAGGRLLLPRSDAAIRRNLRPGVSASRQARAWFMARQRLALLNAAC